MQQYMFQMPMYTVLSKIILRSICENNFTYMFFLHSYVYVGICTSNIYIYIYIYSNVYIGYIICMPTRTEEYLLRH